jgi:hypothetical protein
MTSYSQVLAVLTGDVVASRKAGTDATDQAFRILSKTASELSLIADANTRFTRFRGDGWQLVLGRAGWVLRACLMITADLRASGLGIDTRISAGLGRYDTLGTANLSDAAGPAFVTSGHLLDLAPRRRRLLVAGGSTRDQAWQAAIFDLIENQTAGWTQPQAEAVAIALRAGHLTQAEIADQLEISRQAVQIRLSGAGYSALENALAAFEHLDWSLTDA